MSTTTARPADGGTTGAAAPATLGHKLRRSRTAAGVGLRELARRVGLSASLVSQIENDKVQPSVSTLYAIVTELGISLDHLFGVGSPTGLAAQPAVDVRRPVVTRASDRQRIDLGSGVHWERLTGVSLPPVDFLLVHYEPGAESSPEGSFQRHSGREWGYLISGELHVAIGFDEHVLRPGDAVTYSSMTPHRLHNPGTETAQALWCHVDG